MMKINELAPEQETALAERYEEWLKIGHSVEPIDQQAAREVVNEFYARLGKPAPLIMTFSSPAMCCVALSALKNLLGDRAAQLDCPLGCQLWSQLGSELWSQLGNKLWNQLGRQLISRLTIQFENQLGGQLGGQIGGQIEGQLRSQRGYPLGSQLERQLKDQFGGQFQTPPCGQLESPPSNYLGAQHWCWWEAFYDFPRELGAIYSKEQNEQLDLWIRQARSLHWWFPYDGVVLLSERYTTLHLDEEGRLHCENGPACAYSDGWGVWAWHGTRVTQQIIERPETLTVEQIAAEGNVEARRVMVERMGWNRFCAEAKVKVIHTDELRSHFPDIPVSDEVDPGQRLVTRYRAGVERAELLEANELRDFEDRPLRFVRLTDPSTGRQYTLRVRHDHTRCYEAVGWTFGLSEAEYTHSRFIRQGDVFLKPLHGGPLRQTHS